MYLLRISFAFSKSFFVDFFPINVSVTDILLAVIVPVLSTHNTSILAKVSILFISCSKTFFLPRFIALIARATVTNKYNPSGIIPIVAPTIEVIATLKLASLIYIASYSKAKLTGRTTIPDTNTIFSIALIISVFFSFISFACSDNLFIYESLPTLVNFAITLPATIKLPDFNSLFFTFFISSTSPVNNDSLT